MEKVLVADFETITKEPTYVWCWGVAEIFNSEETFQYGNNIKSFMDFCADKENNYTIYFHNLKFDGSFILSWLLNNGFTHCENSKGMQEKEFSTLISDMGQFYSIEVVFGYDRKRKRRNKVKFLDSLKLLPLSVDNIAKSFKLPISKLSIDYDDYRSENHILTTEEIEYLKNDILIVAMALKIFLMQGHGKMTIGSNALDFYIKECAGGKEKFRKKFPEPEYYYDIKQTYKGGFTYCMENIAGKDVGDFIVLDVNSLYPSVMRYKPLPYDEGIYFKGEYQKHDIYNLFTQRFECQFELKKNHIPTIQLKNNFSFIPTEYIKSSNNEIVQLNLTSVDYDLFLQHYNVYNIEFIDGYMFRSSKNFFAEYVDYWNEQKVQATIEKNAGQRTIAKLFLNSLYGKFASKKTVCSKIPYLDENKILRFTLSQPEDKETIYLPLGAFVTAWARYITISSAQKVYKRFMYADTDSLHLSGKEIPKELNISETNLGEWKIEFIGERARYLRAKTYIEYGHEPNKTKTFRKITVAGLPSRCHKYVTWKNFHVGVEYNNKLRHINVQGGIVLEKTTFNIK